MLNKKYLYESWLHYRTQEMGEQTFCLFYDVVILQYLKFAKTNFDIDKDKKVYQYQHNVFILIFKALSFPKNKY